jgi:cell division septation protein DedD
MQGGARGFRWGGLLPLGVALATSCGPSSSDVPASRAPVADTSPVRPVLESRLAGWGLLGVPREGGPPVYLSLPELEPAAWPSAVALPPVRRLAGGMAAALLLGVRGDVGLYELPGGRYVGVRGVRATHVWGAPPGAAVVADTATRRLSLADPREPWSVTLDGVPVWADWLEGERLAVLVRGPRGAELVVYRLPHASVLARRAVAASGDPVVAAWGSRIYVPAAGPDGTPAVVGWRAADLSQEWAVSLPAPGLALAATPSGHRLYAADAEGTLHVIDRARARVLRRVRLPGPARALRFNATGEVLLARLDGDRVAAVLAGVDRVVGMVDAQWAAHLPWGAPGGGHLVALSARGELRIYETAALEAATDPEPVARGPADAGRYLWWPVAWTPPAAPAAQIAAGPAASAPGRAPAPAPAADPATPPPGTSEGAAESGVYAVVGAARNPEGIRSLSVDLAAAGFPTRVDRHVDDMGTVWYRALVGPYPDRSHAEAAASRVAAARGIRPWILELRPDRATEPR